MFNLNFLQWTDTLKAELLVILAIVLLILYVFYRLNLFKKE